ncbi:uncharacterized protein BDR25DRAFT_362212 [Lindgomyces ingoldianus]|uniref:Uncharacterized protein n=1 Tax=Lindgomyces ingoldianus TaxID=673940 RepID=A0ACB6QAK8_9PLEO|nr:uncharacterized protein BDR25DRAFT_362212 [Lindgomyces ingoldianus]KAF2463931.1 hypothetical protein BDR25DRAFT_362212 [Lindgomyces ingoldianus]
MLIVGCVWLAIGPILASAVGPVPATWSDLLIYRGWRLCWKRRPTLVTAPTLKDFLHARRKIMVPSMSGYKYQIIKRPNAIRTTPVCFQTKGVCVSSIMAMHPRGMGRYGVPTEVVLHQVQFLLKLTLKYVYIEVPPCAVLAVLSMVVRSESVAAWLLQLCSASSAALLSVFLAIAGPLALSHSRTRAGGAGGGVDGTRSGVEGAIGGSGTIKRMSEMYIGTMKGPLWHFIVYSILSIALVLSLVALLNLYDMITVQATGLTVGS